MILKIIIILFVFFPTAVISQTSTSNVEKLSHSENKNSAWVDKMIIEVENILNSESKLAFEYSNIILDVSYKLDYSKGTQNATLQNAKILNILGKYIDAKKQIEIGLKIIPNNNFAYKINALIILGKINYNLGSYDSALVVYDKAEEILGNNLNNIQIADIYNNRANIYILKGDYKLAIENYLKSADIYKILNQKKLLAVVYTNIGNVNANFKMHDKSIEYFKLAAEINVINEDLLNLSINYLNMGVSYKEIDSLDIAVEYYEKSLTISEKLGSTLVMVQNYSNLANIYEKRGDYKKALEFFDTSLNLCKKGGITYGIALNHANIGNTNFLLKNYEVAILNLDSALKYINVLGLPKEKSIVYERLTKIYKEKLDYKNAFYFQSLFTEIKDSLVTAEKYKQIVELQTKFDVAENKKTILELKTKQISQKLTIVYLIVLALLLILLVVWFIYRRKQSLQEKLIADITADKMKLEIEIKNNELAHKTLNIIHLKENNKHIATNIEEFLKVSKDSNQDMKQLVKKIKSTAENSKIWDEFDLRFKEIHSNFYSKIISNYPDLSPVELRLVSLLHLNLTTKEIAEILQRSFKTIENTRGIIRKKMSLDRNVNLTSFILGIK
ncbi:MAG: tetratricopeptide repeat protein [Algoriphagus sp.]|uniref:tetratricopeptide repeat protein n=1 Tax=Algoriphagus sp. TaxID=1872435 RepID=UPI00260BAEEB|nr:tetratricopeptide repeat protein [Algoriphagus sp.]MDG1278185.1 tetratricopeptide repeat protein [Algoriphagus sp.]